MLGLDTQRPRHNSPSALRWVFGTDKGFSFRANRFMLTLGLQTCADFRMWKHVLKHRCR